MPRILALSSQVARGHVGLSATVPALQALGHEVIALPTVILSNHPGHGAAAGQTIAPNVLQAMADALDRNGWLDEIVAIATGYLPTPEHVAFAISLVGRVREKRNVLLLCDPVLGDDGPGVYIDPLAAALIRDRLAPLADILTPNRFELGWLTGERPKTTADVLAGASALASARMGGRGRAHGPSRLVAVTSAAVDTTEVVNLMVHGNTRLRATVRWQDRVPHGTGDLFAALLLGHLLDGESDRAAFARTVSGVDLVVTASAGHDELRLAATLPAAAAASSCEVALV